MIISSNLNQLAADEAPSVMGAGVRHTSGISKEGEVGAPPLQDPWEETQTGVMLERVGWRQQWYKSQMLGP